ncbi:DUF1702 family protein [Nucisporomicrobium flavum]|uniref:DUF1702 family protein n=1 Tax=Nucisporomicrobium flavum TaxID=2785915 RepID=UPI003C2AE020
MAGSEVLRTATAPGWRRVLRLPPSMVDFERRGFRTGPAQTRTVLEAAARTFLEGYHAELATRPGEPPELSAVPPDRRGFAAEGAAMAAVLLDSLRPAGAPRSAALHAAHDDRYAYLIHVGAGWALAKLRRNRLGRVGAGAPLLRWLAYDGMGFCTAFFAGPRALRRWSHHPGTCPATCDIRYQGFGRALWFRACGDPSAVAASVAALPVRHRDDAWSGVALAATYAGGVADRTYAELYDRAAGHRDALAQGCAFGAEAWRLCAYAPPHAAVAAEVLTGGPPERAAGWTWAARRGLDLPGADAGDYRAWRQRVQAMAAAVQPGRPS